MRRTLDDVSRAIVDCEHKTAPAGDGYAWSVGTRAMKDGRLVMDACKPISKSTYEEWTRRMRPEPGDLVLAREAPVGQVIRVPTGQRICLGQRTVLIRPDADKVHPRFLHYWLLGPSVQHTMTAQASGATVPHLNVEDIRRLSIVELPADPAVQQFAAELLGSIDDLIENNRRRIELLEQMAQAIYREWFVHFRYPGHDDVPLVGSPLGPIPQGWKAGRVDDHLVLQRGFDLPLKDRDAGLVPVMAASGRNGWHSNARVGGPGVVTGRSGTIGLVAYVSTAFWPLNTALWTKEFRLATPRFAYCLLSSIDLRSLAAGAAVPTLDRKVVHAHPAVCPPSGLIRTFDDYVQPMFDAVWVGQQASTSLTQVRDLLLPKLVTGQIDVSELDLDALVESVA